MTLNKPTWTGFSHLGCKIVFISGQTALAMWLRKPFWWNLDIKPNLSVYKKRHVFTSWFRPHQKLCWYPFSALWHLVRPGLIMTPWNDPGRAGIGMRLTFLIKDVAQISHYIKKLISQCPMLFWVLCATIVLWGQLIWHILEMSNYLMPGLRLTWRREGRKRGSERPSYFPLGHWVTCWH